MLTVEEIRILAGQFVAENYTNPSHSDVIVTENAMRKVLVEHLQKELASVQSITLTSLQSGTPWKDLLHKVLNEKGGYEVLFELAAWMDQHVVPQLIRLKPVTGERMKRCTTNLRIVANDMLFLTDHAPPEMPPLSGPNDTLATF